MIDLINKKFGGLLVVDRQGYNKRGDPLWKCKCDCGNETIVYGASLRNGTAVSCGCKKRLKGNKSIAWKGYEGITGTYWCKTKISAKRRNIYFDLTIDYVWDLFLKQNKKCSLSNVDIYMPKNSFEEQTASLDRIDSSKGYIEGNVQWVHKDINKMKDVFNEKHFIEMCSKVCKHRGNHID